MATNTGVGAAIRHYRLESGLTQVQLADAAGVSVGQVRDLEQGRTLSPRWDSVEALAAALGLRGPERARLATWASAGRQLSPQGQADRTAAGQSGSVTVRILGPVEAYRGAHMLDLGPLRRKAILALLVLQGAAGVRKDEITELFWPGQQPSTSAGIIQGHISHLRRMLDGEQTTRPELPYSRQLIVRSGESYLLGPGLHSDLVEFEQLASDGAKARAAGDAAEACVCYERALELWHGDAAADLDCLRDHPLVVNLNTLRSEVTVQFADAAMRGQHHTRVLPQLREACAREPLSEVLHALLITTLGAAGRRSEAATVFDGLRHRLQRDLGIRPSDTVWRAYGLLIGQEAGGAEWGLSLLAPSKAGADKCMN